ncbi:uncharacterized protein LOC106089710 [Stomoxys calcitrans]|uniref:uncharacterized protein LOC106089710 n=1 Tax=Stomoxys calcitrans TaxID=35570 RepID=UPI0027E3AE9F|nr:uncharacterized protein LOC106089710 [Stomoxys calcitrans]
MLKEWRETHYNDMNHPSGTTTPSFDDTDSFLDQIELKTECNSEDFDMNDTSKKDFSALEHANSMDYGPTNGQQDENISESQNVLPQNKTAHRKSTSLCGEDKFVVLDILKRSTEGHNVIDFYKINKFLDIKNRKRLVNILIKEVVDRKVDKYTAIFHDMTRQIIEVFPNEKYETYFVAHSGSQSARGALYYRYSNYTRQLRKEGLLAYKKQKLRTYLK